MIPRFTDVIAAINDLKDRSLIHEYAIFGAIAQAFWDEAVPTFDVDVLVLIDVPEGGLVSLGPIYAWARERSYAEEAEHIVISGIPVQFLPAPDRLSEEAITNAKTLPINDLYVRVVSPEYLIALWLTPPANSRGRKERARRLRDSVPLDEALLGDLMTRYNLTW